MGKIRYSLTYLIFWFIIVFSCLLVENFDIFSENPMGGFSFDSTMVLSVFILLLIVIYYFYEYKRNHITIDKILFPIIVSVAILFIITIWWQGPRTFISSDDQLTRSVVFSFKDKSSFSIQIVIWAAVIYGVLFSFNRYHVLFKSLKWLLLMYIVTILISTFVDIVIEFDVIKVVFEGTNTGNGLQFVVYNSNLWANAVMIALISAMMLNLKKFNFFYYLIMIYFLIYGVFTTCATTIFISFAILLFYTLFEIFALFKKSVSRATLCLVTYLLLLTGIVVTMFLLVRQGNNPVANFWHFVYVQVLQKDFSTFTSRTTIWKAVFTLLLQNPRDLIFGLGYKTGINILSAFYAVNIDQYFALRSCHNGFVEILLRHGLVGLTLYIAALGVFVFGFIKLIKKKKYRFFFLYALASGALLTHGLMESTMFLSSNVNGLYLTIVFFAPIVSEIQDRKIEILQKDLSSLENSKIKISIGGITRTIATLTLGLFFAAILSLTLPIDNDGLMKMVVLLIAGVSFLAYWLIPLFGNKIKSVKQYFDIVFFGNAKESLISVTLTLIIGVVCSFTVRQLLIVDRFTVLAFACLIFTIHLLCVALVSKKEQLIAFSYINDSLLSKLKMHVKEEQNG